MDELLQRELHLAHDAQRAGRLAEAEQIYRQILARYPDMAEAPSVHNVLGVVLAGQGRQAEAIDSFRMAAQLNPDDASAHGNLGLALQSLGNYSKALISFQRALALRPDGSTTLLNMGILHAELGEIGSAIHCYREAVRCDESNAKAHYRLAITLGAEITDKELESIQHLLGLEGLPAPLGALLNSGLAYVYDAKGDYQQAAEHAATANALQTAHLGAVGVRFDPEGYDRVANQIIETIDAPYLDRTRPAGLGTNLPIFIFGLPRSGTTLVEQILAHHPQVHGAGELDHIFKAFESLPAVTGYNVAPIECLSRLDNEQVQRIANSIVDKMCQLGPHAQHVTNKLPDNYLILGWIATLLPKATLIHCRRDVRDIAVSCWLTHFESAIWTHDLKHIAARIKIYQRLMDHWRGVLGGQLLEVDYEQLVADPERTTRELLQACGLPWDPGCLTLHDSRRPVRTASETQVRHPIHSKSVARHQHYQDYLADLFAEIRQE